MATSRRPRLYTVKFDGLNAEVTYAPEGVEGVTFQSAKKEAVRWLRSKRDEADARLRDARLQAILDVRDT